MNKGFTKFQNTLRDDLEWIMFYQKKKPRNAREPGVAPVPLPPLER